MDKLSSGIEYFTGVSATLVVIFTDTNNQFTLLNFLSKYQDELGIALKNDTYQEEYDGWLLHTEQSSEKDINRICAIIEEDIDIYECYVLSLTNNN
tara:strand:- start:1462 stop:1749 length:288 start_codon:yes stop_codon:yes gene_type:complete